MKGQTRLPRTKKGTPPPYRHHSSGQVVITLPDWFPALADLVTEMMGGDEGPDARFEFGLDVIVQGLSTIAAHSSTPPPP